MDCRHAIDGKTVCCGELNPESMTAINFSKNLVNKPSPQTLIVSVIKIQQDNSTVEEWNFYKGNEDRR